MTQYIEGDVSACKLTLENRIELREICRSRYLQKKVYSQLYSSGVTQKAQSSCNNAEFLRKTSGNHFDSNTYLSLLKQTSNLNFRYCPKYCGFPFSLWRETGHDMTGIVGRVVRASNACKMGTQSCAWKRLFIFFS